MDIAGSYKKVILFTKKYKYVALVLLLGVLLMILPVGNKNVEASKKESTECVQVETSVSVQLESVLSKVYGAGKVSVMLTVAAGEETIYQTNDDISNTNDQNSYQKDTVTVTDAERNQNGLIRQVNPPTYLGAVIVCEGADDPSVRLAIVNAVSKVTGLGTDRIAVLKMK